MEAEGGGAAWIARGENIENVENGALVIFFGGEINCHGSKGLSHPGRKFGLVWNIQRD